MIARLKKAAMVAALVFGVSVVALPLVVAALALFVAAALVGWGVFFYFKLRG